MRSNYVKDKKWAINQNYVPELNQTVSFKARNVHQTKNVLHDVKCYVENVLLKLHITAKILNNLLKHNHSKYNIFNKYKCTLLLVYFYIID